MDRSRSTTARIQPDQPLAVLVGLVLEAHGAERHCPGDRRERGLRDRNADHRSGLRATLYAMAVWARSQERYRQSTASSDCTALCSSRNSASNRRMASSDGNRLGFGFIDRAAGRVDVVRTEHDKGAQLGKGLGHDALLSVSMMGNPNHDRQAPRTLRLGRPHRLGDRPQRRRLSRHDKPPSVAAMEFEL
jgi:hypothetical protein